MESDMRPLQVDQAQAAHLRFVFSDKVVSFGIGKDMTVGEIARKFAELARHHRSKPIAVAVTLSHARSGARSTGSFAP
jgi:hypothetical protein